MQTAELIAGNVCSLCACVTDSISGAQKKRERMLGIQIISQFFYGAGSVILKGYSGTAQNAVAVLRNLAAIKNVKSKAVEWILIGLGVALGVIFNNRGLLGWLPIVANLEYSVAMFRFKEGEKGLKIAFVINMLMFCVFNAVISNFVGVIANFAVAAVTAVSMIRDAKRDGTADGEEHNDNSGDGTADTETV